jgi:NTE family protein
MEKLNFGNHSSTMTKTLRSKLSFIILLIFLFTDLFSQNERPKVGLVLSGGGAKGVAHVGILKAMEEAGLTPDFITGTSMGSIVGGLYSIGYSADDLKVIVETANWDELLTNKISLDKVTFEEKFYYGRYLLDFYVEDKKIQLPKGIIEGQALMELFSNLTRPVHGVSDFNDFPIPFACVGSNIVTGEPVVLNKGSLAMSMRASMAIPSIFTPVRIDGNLLVDGGLLRNMPVEEVLEMGADIVIGVFVSSDLDPEEKLNSAVSILSQSAFIKSAFDSREQMEKCDILIIPNLEGYSTGSFSSAAGILERGVKAGEAYYDTFKKLADSLRKIGTLHEVIKPEIRNEYVFDEIEIVGNRIIKDAFVLGKMRIEPGQQVTISHIEQRLNVIYGTQYFEKMWYEILGEESHQRLVIHVVERPKIQMRFAYHYDSENKGGIIGNLTLRNLIWDQSRLIFEADMATHPSLLLDYFKYLGKKQNLAFGASGVFSRNELPSYDSLGNQSALFGSTYSAGGLKFQTTRLQSSTFGGEVLWANLNLKPQIISDDLRPITKIQYNNTVFRAFYHFNNMNERYFPTSGLIANIEGSITTNLNGKVVIGDSLDLGPEELGGLLHTNQVHSIELTLMPIIPLSSKISVIAKARMKLSDIPGNTFNLTEYDFVGGFSPGLVNSNEYYGVGIKEFGVANYFYGRIGIQYYLLDRFYLQGHFNFLDTKYPVTWFYPDADFVKLGDRYRRFGYGAMFGMKSPIGPIAFAIAKDHYRKGWKTSLIIGYHY